MKRMSGKDSLLLLALLGVLLAVGSYFLIYSPNREKTEALREENDELAQSVTDLDARMQKKTFYLEETERMKQEIQDIYGLFPVDTREEDSILLAIEQEASAPMTVEAVTIHSMEKVPFSEEAGEEDTGEGTEDDSEDGNFPELYSRQTTINYRVSYEGLKRSIRNICEQPNRMGIEKLSVAFDETTGMLAGSTVVNMYCVPGQEGKEYREPDFSSVLLGTDNIFGTIEIHSEQELPEQEETEQETTGTDGIKTE
jgi:hypothetical protein